MKIEECDFICPSHFINWKYFGSTVKSWFDEIPIRKLFFGHTNFDEKISRTTEKFLSQYDKVEFIEQDIKTLGMKIADLMKRVETEFFVYCHNDAFLTKHSFLVLEADMEDDVGIVESERVQYPYKKPKLYPTLYVSYHYNPRAFSGYQLFRKEAVEHILDKIEDDYMYRNEDLVFQNACENAGYRYVKSFGMHIHRCTKVNQIWTPQGKPVENAKALSYDMHVKGLVKYCTPTPIAVKAWRAAYGSCFRLSNMNIFDFVNDFVMKINPAWKEGIHKTIFELLERVYK